MPDLERWLADAEGWHHVAGQIYGHDVCGGCRQVWPCDTITLARVVREYQRAWQGVVVTDFDPDLDQRIAAIIEGRDHE